MFYVFDTYGKLIGYTSVNVPAEHCYIITKSEAFDLERQQIEELEASFSK